MGMSRASPLPPAPRPRRPLAAEGPEAEKRLCAWGGGGPGQHPRGRPQAQECGDTSRPPEPECLGLRRAACAHLAPVRTPQSLLGGLPPLQGSFQPVMTRLCLSTVALELTPSPAPRPILLPCRVLASFGQIPESRSVENFLPHPLPGELRSQCCTHGVTWVGDFSRGLSFPSVKCRA